MINSSLYSLFTRWLFRLGVLLLVLGYMPPGESSDRTFTRISDIMLRACTAHMRKRKRMDPISARLHEEAERKLERDWVNIAAFAWKEYLNYGRGLLFSKNFVNATYVTKTDKNNIKPVTAPSLPEEQKEQLKKVFQEWAGDSDAWIDTYDPQKEVIVTIWLEKDNGLHNFLLSQEPYPPVAYEMNKQRFLKN
jgi:hypothetical protein